MCVVDDDSLKYKKKNINMQMNKEVFFWGGLACLFYLRARHLQIDDFRLIQQ